MQDNQHGQEPTNEEAPNYISYLSDNFSSIYFGPPPENVEDALVDAPGPAKTQKLIANLVTLLTDQRQQMHRNDVLLILKNNQAQQALVYALKEEKYRHAKPALVTACWETGLDFSDYLPVFVDLAISEPVAVCLECMTVIEEMTGEFLPAEID